MRLLCSWNHPFCQLQKLRDMSLWNSNMIRIIHGPGRCPQDTAISLRDDDVTVIGWSEQVNDHVTQTFIHDCHHTSRGFEREGDPSHRRNARGPGSRGVDNRITADDL